LFLVTGNERAGKKWHHAKSQWSPYLDTKFQSQRGFRKAPRTDKALVKASTDLALLAPFQQIAPAINTPIHVLPLDQPLFILGQALDETEQIFVLRRQCVQWCGLRPQRILQCVQEVVVPEHDVLPVAYWPCAHVLQRHSAKEESNKRETEHNGLSEVFKT